MNERRSGVISCKAFFFLIFLDGFIMNSIQSMVRHSVPAAIVLAIAWTPQLWAHDLRLSYVTMKADEDYLHVEMVINWFELNFLSEIDTNKNNHLDIHEIEAQQEEIARRIADCLMLRVDGQEVTAEVCGLVPNPDTHHLTLRVHYPIDAREAAISLESHLDSVTTGMHVAQVSLTQPSGHRAGLIDAHSPIVSFAERKESMSGEEALSPTTSPSVGWIGYLIVGIVTFTSMSIVVFKKMMKGSS